MSDERRTESARPARPAYSGTGENYRRDEWGWRWARGLEMNEEERRRHRKAARRAKKHREEFPGKVRVVHPKYGEVIVPGASPFAAILCAAERWGCDWADIRDAKVLAVGDLEKDKKEQPTRAGVDCEG